MVDDEKGWDEFEPLEPAASDAGEGAADEGGTGRVEDFDPLGIIGKTIGKHRIIRFLGGGGFGKVYLAEHESLKDERAIKFLTGTLGGTQEEVREALLQVKLKHENIVWVYDVGAYEGMPYIVMELVDGTSLRDILVEKGKLDLGDTLNYAHQIARALEFAHNLPAHKTGAVEGIIHLDLKPENILVSSDGTLKLTDFGTARAVPSEELTRISRDIGTIGYIAPERYSGKVGTPSDVWSFGVILHEMLTGQLPEAKQGTLELLPEVGRISKDFHGLIQKMIRSNPQKRPNAGEVLGEIKEMMPKEGREIPRLRVVASVGLLLVLIAGLVYSLNKSETFFSFTRFMAAIPFAPSSLPDGYAGLSEAEALDKAEHSLASLDSAYSIFSHLSTHAEDAGVRERAAKKVEHLRSEFSYPFISRPLADGYRGLSDEELFEKGERALGEFTDAERVLSYLARNAENVNVKNDAGLNYAFVIVNYHKSKKNLYVAHYLLSDIAEERGLPPELKTAVLRNKGLIEHEMGRCDLATMTFAKLLSSEGELGPEAQVIIADCARRIESAPQGGRKLALVVKTVLPNNILSLLMFITSIGIPSVWLLVGQTKHKRKRIMLLAIFVALLICNFVINQINSQNFQSDVQSALSQIRSALGAR